MNYLTRYWIEFEKTEYATGVGLQLGCGVTAYDYDDALSLVKDLIFKGDQMPRVVRHVENVNINDLDSGHVRPNMWTPSFRGIWYPDTYHSNY